MLAIVVAGYLVTLMPSTVLAKSYQSMSPTERAKSWLYANTLVYCIKNDNITQVYNDVTSGQFFAKGAGNLGNGQPFAGAQFKAWGFPTKNVSGTINATGIQIQDCGDTGWIKDASQLWGYGSGSMQPLYCAMFNFTDSKGRACLDNTTEDFHVPYAYRSTLTQQPFAGMRHRSDALNWVHNALEKNNVYSNGQQTISDSGWYIISRLAFEQVCLGGQLKAPSSSNNDQFTYRGAQMADPNTGVVTPQDYYGTVKNTDNIRWYVDTNGSDGNETTCKKLLDTMNGYAPKYTMWFTKHPGQQDTGATAAGGSGKAGSGTGSTTSCAVGWVGWIVCPVVNFLVNVTRGVFDYISGFLAVKASSTTDPHVTQAWGMIRNIANIAFVLVF